MRRFSSLLLASTALVVAGCARKPQVATPERVGPSVPFTSDRISVITRGPPIPLAGEQARPLKNIVFVHGLAAHRDLWSFVATRLDGAYRLHLVQINGFGGAPPGANAEGLVSAPVAEEIARYIRYFGAGRMAIVGHSMGGAIAMMVAARHPDLVSHLMVLDEPPSLGAVFNASGDSLRHMADGLRDAILNAPAGTLGPFEQMLPGMTRTAAQRPALINYAHASYRPTVANAFHELILTDLRPELGRITAPTTVLYVVPSVLPMSADQFRQNLERAFSPIRSLRLVRVDGSEHYIQIDQPARVEQELRVLIAR